MRYYIWLIIIGVFTVTNISDSKAESKSKKYITTPSGLKYLEVKEGNGAVAKKGDLVQVHYTGTLESGKKFDSSRDRGEPIEFLLGHGQVIKGWDGGIEGMKIGDQRQLIIPPELGYGSIAMGDVIPANSTLLFDVEPVGVE